jgi:hypothetical protein
MIAFCEWEKSLLNDILSYTFKVSLTSKQQDLALVGDGTDDGGDIRDLDRLSWNSLSSDVVAAGGSGDALAHSPLLANHQELK